MVSVVGIGADSGAGSGFGADVVSGDFSGGASVMGIASVAGAGSGSGSGAGMVSFIDAADSGAISAAALGSALVSGIALDPDFVARPLSSGGGMRSVTDGVRLPGSNVMMLWAVVLIQYTNELALSPMASSVPCLMSNNVGASGPAVSSTVSSLSTNVTAKTNTVRVISDKIRYLAIFSTTALPP